MDCSGTRRISGRSPDIGTGRSETCPRNGAHGRSGTRQGTQFRWRRTKIAAEKSVGYRTSLFEKRRDLIGIANEYVGNFRN